MELYKRYPKLCTLWCYIECAFFAGTIYGWGSLMSVLKEEGFYGNECENPSDLDVVNVTVTVSSLYIAQSTETLAVTHLFPSNRFTLSNVSESEGSLQSEQSDHHYTVGTVVRRCFSQDSKLNFWFLISAAIAQATCPFLGPMVKKLGLRYFRLFYMILYLIGLLCLAFASPIVPWLIGPGLACIGAGGLALYSTSVQISFLFPAWQSTVMAFFVGLFDVSAFTQQIVKTAYENNIERKYSYIILSIILTVLCTVSTFIMLPASSFVETSSPQREKTKRRNSFSKTEPFIQDEQAVPAVKLEDVTDGRTNKSRASYIISLPYLLHVFWMCTVALRFVSYLAFLNNWLIGLSHGNREKVNSQIAIFSYTTNGTLIAALTAGALHDHQRRKYQNKGDFLKSRRPMVLPLTLTILLAVMATIFTLFKHDVLVYFSFISFTMFRSYGYSYQLTYICDVFPREHFPLLLGLVQFLSGMSAVLQYPLFIWFESYPQAPTHVTIFLLCLEVMSLCHPLYLWYSCRQHKTDSSPKALELLVKT